MANNIVKYQIKGHEHGNHAHFSLHKHEEQHPDHHHVHHHVNQQNYDDHYPDHHHDDKSGGCNDPNHHHHEEHLSGSCGKDQSNTSSKKMKVIHVVQLELTLMK